MSDNKTLTQTLKLDNKEFIGPLTQARAAAKSATDEINKDLTNNSKSFQQNEAQVKKWGGTITSELQKASRAALENLKTGAKAMTLGAGEALIRKSASNMIEDAVESSKKLAEIASKFNASKTQVESWNDSIKKAAINTKTSIGQMTDVLSEFSDSVDDPSKVFKYMESIGQATLMNGGNSKGVTDFLKKDVVAHGKDMNTVGRGDIDDSLGAANLLMRTGKGFTHQADAMAAISGLDSNAVRSSGLNPKQIASILAGASKSGVSGEASMAGVHGLLGEITKGDRSVFARVLGIGSLKDKDGKLDLSNLGKANARLDNLGGDEDSRKSRLGELAGMSDKEAEGVFAFIRQNKAFSDAMGVAEKDTKTFSESFKQASNNLKDNMQGLQTKVEAGLDDIFKGFKEPLNDLIQGNVGKAAGGLGHGLGQAAIGMKDHPALVAGAFATVLGGGALITGLLSKLGGGGALGAGVAKGKMLEQAGVTPVYVVNFAEMGGGGGTAGGGLTSKALPFLKKMGSLMGMAGTTLGAIGTSSVGALAGTGAAGLATIGGGVAAAGAVGYGTGLIINEVTSAIGNKFDIPSLGEAIYDLIDKLQTQKVELKITKPKGFAVEPNADDNQTDAR